MTTSPGSGLEPFHVDTGRGRRFAIATRPNSEPRGSVLFVHPFAEEMNKSRRMAALASRALADEGWYVLRPDLFGCGDSDGDFGAATWSEWLADIDFWMEWLRAEAPGPALLWGLRASALLLVSWLARTGASYPLLLWQPVTSGQQHLTQFLRLRAAAEMLDARQARGVVTGLKQSLSRGDSVTVAGYTLNPDLANPLAGARLELPDRFAAPVALQEIVPDATSMPAAALGQVREAWTKQGIPVHYGHVTGPSFWRTVEVETAPALIPETVCAVQAMTS